MKAESKSKLPQNPAGLAVVQRAVKRDAAADRDVEVTLVFRGLQNGDCFQPFRRAACKKRAQDFFMARSRNFLALDDKTCMPSFGQSICTPISNAGGACCKDKSGT